MSIKDRLSDPTLLVERASVAGAWIGAATGGTIPVVNPATGEAIATVPDLGAGETRDAIAAAERAWPAWRARPAAERSALLERWHDLMLPNRRPGRDHDGGAGQAAGGSRGEVPTAPASSSGSPKKRSASTARSSRRTTADRRIVVLKEPVGVSAAITPWNFPDAMITRKAAPALAAGCTIGREAGRVDAALRPRSGGAGGARGIPPGVLSVVTGMPAEIGGEMTGNPSVRKLSFTGSTRVGSILMAQCAATVKRSRSSWAATRRSSSSTTPTSIARSRGRWRLSSATGARPASAPIASWSRTGSTTASPNACDGGRHVPGGQRPRRGRHEGPMINAAAVDKIDRHLDDAMAKGATVVAGSAHRGRDRSSADRPHGRDHRHGAGRGGDVRAGRPAVPVRGRGGGGRDRQRHPLRPRGLLLHPRHAPLLARRRATRVRHGRA